MTTVHASSGAELVLPAADPARGARRTPAVAVGLLAAVALGAGVLLLPGGSPETSDELTTIAVVQRVAHPAPPAVPEPTTTTPAPPAAVQFRDPFRPLVSDAGQDAPAAVPDTTVSAPEVVTPPDDEPVPGFELPQAPVTLPAPPGASAGAPAPDATSVVGRTLGLTRVEAAGDDFVAVLSLDGTAVRAGVGASFGPGGELLLLSLQQGPADGQWTAVVQRGRGEPFDVVTGTPTRLP